MAAKIIGTFPPDSRALPRNKVHFHGITISGNWHLQATPMLSGPPPALSYFRTAVRRDRKRRGGGTSVQGMRADRKCVFYTATAPFRFSAPGRAGATTIPREEARGTEESGSGGSGDGGGGGYNKAGPSTAR